jgi:hypothetical protein
LATETDLLSILPLPLLLFAPSLKDSILHETNIRRGSIVFNGRRVGLLVAGILFHSRNHNTRLSGFVNRFLFSLGSCLFEFSHEWQWHLVVFLVSPRQLVILFVLKVSFLLAHKGRRTIRSNFLGGVVPVQQRVVFLRLFLLLETSRKSSIVTGGSGVLIVTRTLPAAHGFVRYGKTGRTFYNLYLSLWFRLFRLFVVLHFLF